MASLEDVLHDTIDEQEELRARAREVVESMRQRLASEIDATGDVEAGLMRIAEIVADELSDLTTEAVQGGRRTAARVHEAQ